MYKIKLICDAKDGIWYIGFTTGGEHTLHLLPTRKKFFGIVKWTPQNCPKQTKGYKESFLHFLKQDEVKNLHAASVQEVFHARYPTIEKYLEHVNNGSKISHMTYEGVRRRLLFLRGRCGTCTQTFTSVNPDYGDGQCQQCWGRSH